jgi:RHS repeat-associated protein
VFFDEISVKVQAVSTAIVVQENHYYPFGLGMRGLDWVQNPNRENKFQYNGGVEKNTDFDLNWYETEYRSLCIQTNRFLQVDPKAEDGGQESLSPYHYSFNNPIRYNARRGTVLGALLV